MKRPRISKKVRDNITTQAKNRCGYCLAPQELLATRLEIDHIIPISKGGKSSEENLWLSCSACNMYKASKVEAIDPISEKIVPLFNPRKQLWSSHFQLSDDMTEISGTTAIGRATVNALKLNNELAVAARRYWVLLGEFPPTDN